MMQTHGSEAPRAGTTTTMDLEGDRALVITRAFRAPARLVFEAWTRAELVRRWWAPRSHGVEFVACDADVRVGGDYRYHLRHPRGDVIFYGTYREVEPTTRLVYTQCLEGHGDAAVVVTVTFTERAGVTEVVSREVYPSASVREAALASGMESGMRESLEQLDELLGSML
ncbi:MAG: SRPBCC family protein [Nannocystaceae bacterium]